MVKHPDRLPRDEGTSMRKLRTLQMITDRVWFAQGPGSNWTVVHTDLGTVLIDAGYPADAPLIMASITATGADPSSLVAILITHAHTDHIGAIPRVLARFPSVSVLSSPAELEATRTTAREQITFATAGLRNLVRPRFMHWAMTAVRAGGARPLSIPTAGAFTSDELAGFGIRHHPAPGHTHGSTIYELVGTNVYMTGDALVTDHPSYTLPRTGALPPPFNSDDQTARHTANAIPQNATILPGHGPTTAQPKAASQGLSPPRIWGNLSRVAEPGRPAPCSRRQR